MSTEERYFDEELVTRILVTAWSAEEASEAARSWSERKRLKPYEDFRALEVKLIKLNAKLEKRKSELKEYSRPRRK